ncbi:SDR family NAD(P)-dependent oxidoreductase [Pararhodonellum marinum]|uniref:SDR family NAD(P)-dependent oxidoreductase n=1 Tax=Pararhodonellum marinum TaxID=2755358 RepID=UPI00188EB486|nr:SDR family NAD(P)-dependent oxidoreductase [Pararhodonellum marinum]
MKYGNVIIFGASSGIGLATSEYLKDKCNNLFTVSRRVSPYGKWIKTDLTNVEEIESLQNQISDMPIDALLYFGGTWESNAFSPEYNFESCSNYDIENVLNVNLLAPIRAIQKFIPNLKKSINAKIIIIGAAIGGLNLNKSKEVSNTASKFGLRGLVFSLRQNLSQHKIGVTLINPGNLSTEEVLNDLKNAGKDETHSIPLTDLFNIVELVLNLSNRTNINEIDLPNM